MQTLPLRVQVVLVLHYFTGKDFREIAELLDDTEAYPASNAYGLTNVPSLFWIGTDGTIEISSVGWMRKEIEEINQKAGEAAREKPRIVFAPGENVPEFRAG
jgi:hypothetical protein